MITSERFDLVKEKYAFYSSWAIWAQAGEKPKSNIGDLSVLDPNQNPSLLSQLNPEIVFLALNISRGDIIHPFGNFHDARSEATDYKIRFALQDSIYWGGYMTDIIKDFDEKHSGKVISYLKKHEDIIHKNIDQFKKELSDIGSNNPTLISFGNDVFNILNKYLKKDFKVLKVPHYASYISKENYRKKFQDI